MSKKVNITIAVLLVVVLSAFCLSGYFSDFNGINIENAAMIKSIGADIGEQYSLTCVQNVVDSSEQTGQTAFTSGGDDFIEALQGVQTACDKDITSAYVRHYLIGTETAEKSIDSVMDFFGRSHTVQLSAEVCFVEGKAEDFLKQAAKQKNEADGMLSDLRVTGESDGYYMPVTFSEVLAYVNTDLCGVVPVVKLTKVDSTQSDTDRNAQFSGYAVIKNGNVREYLNEDQSRGYNFATGNIKNAVLTLPGGKYSFEISSVKSKMNFYTENRQLKRVEISVSFSSYFRQASKSVSFDNEKLSELEILQSEAVKSEILGAVEKSQQTGLDFLGIEKNFSVRHPYFSRDIDNFSSVLRDVEISVDVSCNIAGTYELEKV